LGATAGKIFGSRWTRGLLLAALIAFFVWQYIELRKANWSVKRRINARLGIDLFENPKITVMKQHPERFELRRIKNAINEASSEARSGNKGGNKGKVKKGWRANVASRKTAKAKVDNYLKTHKGISRTYEPSGGAIARLRDSMDFLGLSMDDYGEQIRLLNEQDFKDFEDLVYDEELDIYSDFSNMEELEEQEREFDERERDYVDEKEHSSHRPHGRKRENEHERVARQIEENESKTPPATSTTVPVVTNEILQMREVIMTLVTQTKAQGEMIQSLLQVNESRKAEQKKAKPERKRNRQSLTCPLHNKLFKTLDLAAIYKTPESERSDAQVGQLSKYQSAVRACPDCKTRKGSSGSGVPGPTSSGSNTDTKYVSKQESKSAEDVLAEWNEEKKRRNEARSTTPNFPMQVVTGWEVGHVVVSTPQGVPLCDAFVTSNEGKTFLISALHIWKDHPQNVELIFGQRGVTDDAKIIRKKRTDEQFLRRADDILCYVISPQQVQSLGIKPLKLVTSNVGEFVAIYGGTTQTCCPNAKIVSPNVHNASTAKGDSGTPIFRVMHGIAPERHVAGMHLGEDGTGFNRFYDSATLVDALKNPNSQ
jgi:hypothetical protein